MLTDFTELGIFFYGTDVILSGQAFSLKDCTIIDMTAEWMFDDCLRTAFELPEDFLTTALTTAWLRQDDNKTTKIAEHEKLSYI